MRHFVLKVARDILLKIFLIFWLMNLGETQIAVANRLQISSLFKFSINSIQFIYLQTEEKGCLK